VWQTDRETDRWTDRWTHILSRHSPRYAYASRGNTSGGSVLTLFHKVAWFIYSCSSPLPVIFFILTTFSIHYSITFPLQDEIVPFLQILPTITDFWYLLTVFTDHWTGPDLSHSSAYFLVYFVLIFLWSIKLTTRQFSTTLWREEEFSLWLQFILLMTFMI